MPARKAKRVSRSTSPRRQTKNSRYKTIVRIVPATERPWELDDEAITILKNSVAKGASNEELKFCLTVARRYRLDPFKQQIWFVPRWDKNAARPDGGKGANVYTPTVGIHGMLHAAARDHRDFGSISLPEYGPMRTVEYSYEYNGKTYNKKIQAPEWAKIKVWKKGVAAPTEAIAYWDEYAPADLDKAPFWRKMPRRMLGKCVTALGVRQAYPDLGGLYIPEECERIQEDYTPSGRRIISSDAPEGFSQPQLVEDAPHGHQPGSRKAQMAEETLRKVEEQDRQLLEDRAKAKEFPGSTPGREAAHVASGSTEAEGLKPSAAKYHLEIDRTNPEDPIIRGDVDFVKTVMGKHIVATWGKDEWWHIRPVDVDTIHAASKSTGGFSVTELSPTGEKGADAKRKAREGQPASTVQPAASVPKNRKEGTSTGGAGPTGTSADPVSLKGRIERVFVTLKGDKSLALVTVVTANGKREAGCWDKTVYEFLDKGLGKDAEVFIRKNGDYTNIIGLKRIGSIEFEDGKIPVLQNSQRTGGTETLFK